MISTTIEQLNWRYATKQYDTSRKLTGEQRDMIKEALRLAPSSFGLQAWRFVHVTDVATREKLRAAAYGQPQLTDASDLFVLCYTDIDEASVRHFVEETAKAQNASVEQFERLQQTLMNSVQSRTPEQLRNWASHQVYIALGVGLSAAAANQIDASPMEGFDNAQFDEILGLKGTGVHSQVIFAVGFRSADDAYAKHNKVRFPTQEVFIER